jgi:hypothetical protein
MVAIRPVHRNWKVALIDLFDSACKELVVVAPFMTADGISVVEHHLSAAVRDHGRLEMITDLSPAHVCDGSLDTDALARLTSTHEHCHIWHVPALHAKVYIADSERALVTSGNLTAGAFRRNVEYGVEIVDASLVGRIREDMTDIQTMGAKVDRDSMRRYADVARNVRQTLVVQRTRIDPEIGRAFTEALRSAETELIRLRLAGGAMHTIFSKTIMILLARHGAMPTTSIHSMIQQLHPDLCDDTVDRVIEGRSFGKKWKHAVRTAQQQLKKRGVVEYDGEVWNLTIRTGDTK